MGARPRPSPHRRRRDEGARGGRAEAGAGPRAPGGPQRIPEIAADGRRLAPRLPHCRPGAWRMAGDRMTKPLPRFELAGRIAESDLRSLTRPVPPLVSEAAGEAAAAHERLAHRFGESGALVIATRAKLADVEQADAEAARKAIEQGQPIPKAKADAIRGKLHEAERELQAISELIPDKCAAACSPSAAPHAGRVADEAEQRAVGARSSRALDALRADAARPSPPPAALRNEAGWAQELHDSRASSGRGRRRRSRERPSVRSSRPSPVSSASASVEDRAPSRDGERGRGS